MVVTARPAARCTGVTQERTTLAVEVHGAGAAQRLAAAEFRSRHAESVSQHPQQRCIGGQLKLVCVAVND